MAHLYNEETISQAINTKWAGKTVHFAKETDYSYPTSTPQNRLAKNIQKQYEPNFEEDDIEEKSESEIELLKVLRSIR